MCSAGEKDNGAINKHQYLVGVWNFAEDIMFVLHDQLAVQPRTDIGKKVHNTVLCFVYLSSVRVWLCCWFIMDNQLAQVSALLDMFVPAIFFLCQQALLLLL